jgi:hypothetical protein
MIFMILRLPFIAIDLRIAVDEQGKGTLVLNELLALPLQLNSLRCFANLSLNCGRIKTLQRRRDSISVVVWL